MKKFLLWVITLWLIIFALPFLAVSVKKSADASEKGQKNRADIDMGKEISVYLADSGKCVTMPFEEYITGVVCAEMPALFEVEAIKAQAVAARTYTVSKNQRERKRFTGRAQRRVNLHKPRQHCQAYVPKEEISKKGKQCGEFYKKTNRRF